MNQNSIPLSLYLISAHSHPLFADTNAIASTPNEDRSDPLNDYTRPTLLAPPPAQDGSASSLAIDSVATPMSE